MRWSRRLCARALGCFLSIAAVGLGAAPEARADEATAKLEAREAARRASDAFRDGRHAEALELLQHAESLVHAPTHVLMMARAHAAMGKLVQARRAYQEVATETLPAGAPAPFARAKKDAEKELAELDPKVPRVTIRVTPPDASNLEVKQDGQPIAPAELSAARLVDPGAHTFAATADGLSAEPVTARLAEGARETIELQLKPTTGAPVIAPVPAPRKPTPPASKPVPKRNEPPDSPLRAPAWGAIALGAAGVAVGAALMPVANSKALEAEKRRSDCGAFCSGEELAAAKRVEDNGSSIGTASAVGLAAGGVLVVGGLALLVAAAYGEEAGERAPTRARVDSREARSRSFEPLVGLGALGARGSF